MAAGEAVCVEWVAGPFKGSSCHVGSKDYQVEKFTTELALCMQVDPGRVRLGFNGQVLVDPNKSLAYYGVSTRVYAALSLGSVEPSLCYDIEPIRFESSIAAGFLPLAGIKKLEVLDLTEIDMVNQTNLPGFPKLGHGIEVVSEAKGNIYDVVFDGKFYGLELTIGLLKSEDGVQRYTLAGHFDKLSLFVEKQRCLVGAIKDYARNLREMLLEDAADCGLLWHTPQTFGTMEAVEARLKEVQEKASSDSSELVTQWVPVLILMPVLLLNDEQLQLECKTPLDGEFVEMDGLCEYFVNFEGPRAFVVTWSVEGKSGFQLLSSF